MQTHKNGFVSTLRPVANPRGTQTVAQAKPVLPRSPNGRFVGEFRPGPRQMKP